MCWVGALFGFSIAYRHVDTFSRPWFQDPNLTAIATIAAVSMLIMFVAWIGALARLATAGEWGWFAAVLITQLLGAGIVGMVCYAGLGSEDTEVSRPQVT